MKDDPLYLLPDQTLLAMAEKILYRQTSQEDLYLYLLRPPGQPIQSLPAIVYFTGGGWRDGSPAGMIANAAWFRDAGIIGIADDYRVAKRVRRTLLARTPAAATESWRFVSRHFCVPA